MLRKLIRFLFIKKYKFAPFIYIQSNGALLKHSIGSIVKWLGEVEVEAFSYRGALKKAMEIKEAEYPQYKGWIYYY